MKLYFLKCSLKTDDTSPLVEKVFHSTKLYIFICYIVLHSCIWIDINHAQNWEMFSTILSTAEENYFMDMPEYERVFRFSLKETLSKTNRRQLFAVSNFSKLLYYTIYFLTVLCLGRPCKSLTRVLICHAIFFTHIVMLLILSSFVSEYC